MSAHNVWIGRSGAGLCAVLLLIQPAWSDQLCTAEVSVDEDRTTERHDSSGQSQCDLNGEVHYQLAFEISADGTTERRIAFRYDVTLELLESFEDGRKTSKTVTQSREIDQILGAGLKRQELVKQHFAGCKYGWKLTSDQTRRITSVKINEIKVREVTCKVM